MFSGLSPTAKKRKRALGSICGQRCLASLRDPSKVVKGEGVPPETETRRKLKPSAPKMIWPSLVHAPPQPRFASQITRGVPPARSTRCSLPGEKNAMDLLSGDQNGYAAPSVPGINRATVPSSGLSQSAVTPFAVATNAVVRPSGDKALPPIATPKLNWPPSGG